MICTEEFFLGIAGGGTRTVALLADVGGRFVRRVETGPGDVRRLTDGALLARLREIARALPRPAAIAIGLAGAGAEAQWRRIRAAAAQVWPGIPCHATNELETALVAGEPTGRGGRRATSLAARVLVRSGTGSCCYARATDGRTATFGGWGHILGDKGSGYEIGLRALKAVVFYYDRDGIWSALGRRLLRVLQLNEPGDLVGWVQAAGQREIAALAPEVFAAWPGRVGRTGKARAARQRGPTGRERDPIARDILEGAAHSLAKDAVGCAKKLVRPGAPVDFVLAGGVLLQQPAFARKVARGIRALWPGARVAPLARESVWGAVALAQRMGKAAATHGAHGLQAASA
ncbi:N-acetylmuramic acid/N-acetylglucosamine kinase [Verrucomicrobiota bacterium]|nr:N-acetylmuramic acid/N-acetylglucosamine kinase [Verrucomicrobiota bacterium]